MQQESHNRKTFSASMSGQGNVTAPDLGTTGKNGMDPLATCNTGTSGQQLVSQLQLAGHVMLGFSALQVTFAPTSSLLLWTEPEFQEEIGQALSGARSQLAQRILSGAGLHHCGQQESGSDGQD